MTHEVNRLGMNKSDPVPDTPFAGAVPKQVHTIEQIVDPWEEARAVIARDTSLSPEGRRLRFESVDREAEEKLKLVEDEYKFGRHTIAEHKAELADYEAFVAEDLRTLPEPLDATREREIREHLLRLSASERFAIAQEAAEADDRETLAAIRNAPKRFPILKQNELDVIERLHAERHVPERLAAIANRAKLIDALEYNLDLARRTLRGDGRVRLAS